MELGYIETSKGVMRTFLFTSPVGLLVCVAFWIYDGKEDGRNRNILCANEDGAFDGEIVDVVDGPFDEDFDGMSDGLLVKIGVGFGVG